MPHKSYETPEWMTRNKQPCQTPGCTWPNWHVCIIGKPDLFPQLLNDEARRGEAYRAKLRSSQQIRWEAINGTRDAKIVELYNEGELGMRGVAERIGISHQTVLKVLRRAQDEGLVVIRKRGHTIKTGAK